jgi:hypothetical protein
MNLELQRPLALTEIRPTGREVEVRATAAECAALARRMKVPAINEFSCWFRLSALGEGVVLAEGRLLARAIRVCVLTLDEFEATTKEEFRLRFVPAGQESPGFDPEAEDEIPYQGAALELGEAAAEQLALALDPYPKKPGAALPAVADEATGSPFAVLAGRIRQQ